MQTSHPRARTQKGFEAPDRYVQGTSNDGVLRSFQDAPGAFRDERAFSEPRTMEGFANDLTPNHEEFKDRGALPPQPFSMIARDCILSRDEVRPGTQKV